MFAVVLVVGAVPSEAQSLFGVASPLMFSLISLLSATFIERSLYGCVLFDDEI